MKLIVDAHSLGSRAFYTGQNTFFSMIRTVAGECSATEITLAFDSGTNRRKKIYPDYKANRKEDSGKEARYGFLRKLYIILKKGGFLPTVVEGYEADDVLYTAAKEWGKGATLLSGDKDLWVVWKQTNVVYIPGSFSNRVIVDRATWDATYTIDPEQFADFKGLAGEASDNIPGVYGIGPYNAAKLLNEFGSLEMLYEDIYGVRSEPTRNKLLHDKKSALMSKTLAQLQSVPIGEINTHPYDVQKFGNLII